MINFKKKFLIRSSRLKILSRRFFRGLLIAYGMGFRRRVSTLKARRTKNKKKELTNRLKILRWGRDRLAYNK